MGKNERNEFFMSIFPRRLTRGENCIIHLKFTNSSRILKKLHYNLKILNPNGKIIKDKNTPINGLIA